MLRMNSFVSGDSSCEPRDESENYCAPFLADVFLYLYEADLIQSLLSTGKKETVSISVRSHLLVRR